MKIHKAMLVSIGTVLVTFAAGCGSAGTTSNPTPDISSPAADATPSASEHDAEAVFREFIDAVNASDATRAASLVAMDATFFGQAGSPVDLARSLECTAEIVSLDENGGVLDVGLDFTGTTAWQNDECDVTPEGETEEIHVTVEDGKIVLLEGD